MRWLRAQRWRWTAGFIQRRLWHGYSDRRIQWHFQRHIFRLEKCIRWWRLSLLLHRCKQFNFWHRWSDRRNIHWFIGIRWLFVYANFWRRYIRNVFFFGDSNRNICAHRPISVECGRDCHCGRRELSWWCRCNDTRTFHGLFTANCFIFCAIHMQCALLLTVVCQLFGWFFVRCTPCCLISVADEKFTEKNWCTKNERRAKRFTGGKYFLCGIYSPNAMFTRKTDATRCATLKLWTFCWAHTAWASFFQNLWMKSNFLWHFRDEQITRIITYAESLLRYNFFHVEHQSRRVNGEKYPKQENLYCFNVTLTLLRVQRRWNRFSSPKSQFCLLILLLLYWGLHQILKDNKLFVIRLDTILFFVVLYVCYCRLKRIQIWRFTLFCPYR